ncbi:MAG: hypothetical protein ACO248_00770, partial [Burkholderiaceae bacterium]
MDNIMKGLEDIQAGIGAMGARIDSIEKAQNLAADNTARRLPVGDAGTAGSKFAGLSGSDVAFLHDLVKSGAMLGLRPSEELTNAAKALNRASIVTPASKAGNFR